MGETPRKNRYDTPCSWVLRLIEKNVGHIEETSCTFPPKLLTYLRKVVPEDTVGEFRAESYEVFLKEFCISVDI